MTTEKDARLRARKSGDSPGGHYASVGGALVGMGVLAAVLGGVMTIFLGSGVGFIDGPTALGLSVLMVSLGLWMRAQVE